MDGKQKTTIWFGVVALIVVLGGISLAYAERQPIYAQLNAWKLIPQPERFTELYFENASALPSRTVKKQPIAFAFTIHNVEGTSTVYPYQVYFEYPDGSRDSFRNGTVSLPDGASTTISVSHTFLSSGLEGEVIVNLTSLDQQIDFLLTSSTNE